MALRLCAAKTGPARRVGSAVGSLIVRAASTSVCSSRPAVTANTGNGSVFSKQLAAKSFKSQSLISNATVRFDSSAEPVNVPVPTMGDSISEGAIASWSKAVGDFIKADEVIAVVETDKISVDILSPLSGIVTSLAAEEGDTVFVGDTLFSVTVLEGEEAIKAAAAAAEAKTNDEADVEDEAETVGGFVRKDKTVPMSRMRQKIAERLKFAQENAAALTTYNEVDMSALMKMRTQLNEKFQKDHGVKLGFMSPFILACTKALQRCPDVNAELDGTDIIYKNYVDISVAVATPTGLMVPVIRDCQTKTFHTLEKELIELAGKARNGQISLEDMQGGNFTISNGGVYGSMMGSPLLNPPQSAILGMHSITPRAVVEDGKVVVRPMMYLALTYDHQIIDGREAVTFLKTIKELLEDPRKMLLDI